jgi:Family of unknown function (DUF5994)
MTSQPHTRRSAVPAAFDRFAPHGAWWPRNRTPADQLDDFVAARRPHAGRMVRVLYSPPASDDRPRSVAGRGRRVRTGPTPRDDIRRLHPGDGVRRIIAVVPPEWDDQGGHT